MLASQFQDWSPPSRQNHEREEGGEKISGKLIPLGLLLQVVTPYHPTPTHLPASGYLSESLVATFCILSSVCYLDQGQSDAMVGLAPSYLEAEASHDFSVSASNSRLYGQCPTNAGDPEALTPMGRI